ncbi:MAG: acetate/propionate family kinase [Sphingomonadaceae bacterium]
MNQAVVSLNSGSSSIKFALYTIADDEPVRVFGGKIEGIGTAPRLMAREADGTVLVDRSWPDSATLPHGTLLQEFFQWAGALTTDYEIIGIGHRIVHGGTDFAAPVLVDEDIIAALDALSPLAPLHQPHNLSAVRALREFAPHLPQIACFDTAFHHGRADATTRFALPRALYDAGVRGYGFHGISYEYIAQTLARHDPELAAGRVVVAHLGNGASMCAIHDGRSVDTSMGFSTVDGLMMGTRCGTLDPGVVLYLQTALGYSAEDIAHMLYKQSGLLGVSGISSDMRELTASDRPEAAAAVDMFVWRAARHAAALATTMGGLNGLIFTAGIGENSAPVRARICQHLAWLGLVTDRDANDRNDPVISAPESAITVGIIPTDEEWMIARHTLDVLQQPEAV